jgi:hypothetical protein
MKKIICNCGSEGKNNDHYKILLVDDIKVVILIVKCIFS